MRRILPLLLLLAGPAVAQQVQVVHLPPDAYGKEAYLILPRQSALGVVVPFGDTLWIGNVTDSLKTKADRYLPDCDTLALAVGTSRLKVGVNQTIVTEFPIRERGQVSLTPNFRVPLPGGDTFVVREVYRRKTTCGRTDGLLIVWAVILAP